MVRSHQADSNPAPQLIKPTARNLPRHLDFSHTPGHLQRMITENHPTWSWIGREATIRETKSYMYSLEHTVCVGWRSCRTPASIWRMLFPG